MEQNEVLKALQRNHAAELKLAAERLEGTARHTEMTGNIISKTKRGQLPVII